MFKILLLIFYLFYSIDASSQVELPTRVELSALTLIKVSPQYNEDDYNALMSAKYFIHRALGSDDWPSHDFSKEQNLVTLENDLKDFDLGENFTFHLLDKSEKLIGCVYLTPSYTVNHKVIFSSFYWFIPKFQRDDFESQFRKSLADWVLSLDSSATVDFPLNL